MSVVDGTYVIQSAQEPYPTVGVGFHVEGEEPPPVTTKDDDLAWHVKQDNHRYTVTLEDSNRHSMSTETDVKVKVHRGGPGHWSINKHDGKGYTIQETGGSQRAWTLSGQQVVLETLPAALDPKHLWHFIPGL